MKKSNFFNYLIILFFISFHLLFTLRHNNLYSIEYKSYIPRPDYVSNFDKPFNEYTWLVAHNAFSNATILSNQYGMKISDQLKLGARGLMLDLYDYNGAVYLCHKTCLISEYGTFVDEMNKTIIPFLKENPDVILTLFLEDHSSKPFLDKALSQIQDLEKYTFNPQKWRNYKNWPTLNELIHEDQRLILISENEENSGFYEFNTGEIHIIFGQDISIENYWSLGDTVMTHDYSCSSRWKNVPLTTKYATPFYHFWNRLFVMNHFHGLPYYSHSEEDNKFSKLKTREDLKCSPFTLKMPNYIAVDNIKSGHAMEYVEWHNNGGILFFDKNFSLQNLVCGVSTAFERNFQLYKAGCTNYVTKAQIQGVAKGTKITLYSSDYDKNEREYSEIEIKRDIDFEEEINIDSFDSNIENSDFNLRYFGKSGMKKKVFAIKIELGK